MRLSLVLFAGAVSLLFSLTNGHAEYHSIGVIEPYKETRDPKKAAFSVSVQVNYDGREIRNSTIYFSVNREPGFGVTGGVGTGDGSDGKWVTQSLIISTRDDGIYVRFSDSAGQGGVTHRDLKKRLHLPWTQTEYEEVEGLYSMLVKVKWNKK